MKVTSGMHQVVLMGIILWMLSPFLVYAQMADPVAFQLNKEKLPQSVEGGTIFYITVDAAIDENWYLYSILNDPGDGPIPTTFTSAGSDMIIAGDITESDAHVSYDPNFDTELGLHSQTASFRVPVFFSPHIEGAQKIGINIHYQACDDISCLPPKTVLVSESIEVVKGGNELAGTGRGNEDFGVGTNLAGHKNSDFAAGSNPNGLPYSLAGLLILLLLTLAFIRYAKNRQAI
jgi:hypothetical protein